MMRPYSLSLVLGLGLALLTPSTVEAQSLAGGRSLKAPGKQQAPALQQAPRIRTNTGFAVPMQKSVQPAAKPYRAPGAAGELRGGPPANDDCSGALPLVVGTVCNPVTADATGASQSIPGISCNAFTGTADDDVWFSFVANASALTIEVTSSANHDAVVDLRSGACNGTNIACADQAFDGGTEFLNATGLTVGATYYVRVYDWYQGAPLTTSFDICVYGTPPAPANDNCAGAIGLVAGTSCNPVTGTVFNATQSIPALNCATFTGDADDDVWYSFVANATAMTVRVEGSASFDAVVDLRSGACNGTNIACADATVAGGVETINATGLTVGATYRVRVYDYGTGSPSTPTFDICVFSTPAAPANDECVDAPVAALSVPGSVTVNGDNTGATDSEQLGFNTVWEAFTITACADVTIEYCGTNPAFGEYVVNIVDDCLFTTVYDTASTGACPDGNPIIVFNDLPAGTYYYPVLESGLASGPYTITFTATACGGGTTPPNDECADAVVQTLNVPGTVTVTGDNTGATDSENFGFNTVWEAFTITECADVTVELCGTTPAFEEYVISLTDGCAITTVYDASSGTLCADDNVSLSFLGLQPGTYYYPVLESALATGPYTLTFTAAACPQPPANDECTGAIVLDVETTCQPFNTTNLGATESFAADSCAGVAVGSANDDVWFSFVATGTEHTIEVLGDSLFDPVVQAYSGDCNGLSLIGCEDLTLEGEQETMLLTNLNAGEVYYVRVFDWYLTITADPFFSICVIGDVATGMAGAQADGWSVFPNPTEGELTVVNGGNSGMVTIELFDVAGRLVHAERTGVAAGALHTLDLQGPLTPGTYTLRMTTAGGRSAQRVVVR